MLQFTLQKLAIDAAASFDRNSDPKVVSDTLLEIIFGGLAADPLLDDLEKSDAMCAAREVVADWPSPIDTSSEDDARARIIAAARREFSLRGYNATTIRNIAEAAGVRMATLYRRIESKEEILSDVLRGFSDHFDRAVRAALLTGDSELANVDALAYVFVHARRRFREESDIVAFDWHDREPIEDPIAEYHRGTVQRLRLLEEVMDRGMRKGVIRDLAPAEQISSYLRHILWVPYQDYHRTSELKAQQFLRRILIRGFLDR
ncbi:TetR family transcriptional regulator [Rhodococcus ruber BKS 20-38]|uniref:TetR family transcriptional regulator n=1 Tax=Rhodococcus ruber BKS 20-38 TaxID=1278076 RepID=M3A318_9NOCA|nr:TetR family transcriptional regulator [Rhodococcus ruber BKS 20-38]